MVTLALALLLSQTPQHRLFLQPNLPQGASYAFFEAFPANGAGTSGPCSTTPPTGAKGEVLTFTRASNGTCTKTATGGLATTGIANGDLVVLSSNQPRVEYDSAGTLGLLVEASRTNSTIRSQELDNAAWINDGAKPPTITANFATAPDGTTTADRVQTQATSAIEAGDRAQLSACPVGVATLSFYARALSGSPTVDGCINIGTVSCAARVTLSTASHTRVVHTATVASNGHVLIGNHNTNGAASAGDFIVWGVQCEAGAYATSYIPTGASTATRSGESGSFPVSLSGSSLSVFVSAQPNNVSGVAWRPIQVANQASVWDRPYWFSSSWQGEYGSLSAAPAAVPAASPPFGRWGWYYDGSTITQCASNGSCSSVAATSTSTAYTSIGWGIVSPTWVPDSIVSRVCLDLPSRCR